MNTLEPNRLQPLPPRVPAGRVWNFADAVLDEQALQLKVRGQVVAIEPKPLEVLMFLVQRAGTLVTKTDLAQAVWPGRLVTDSNLTKCIALVRYALLDRSHTIIKTVHGYGYRVNVPVTLEEPAAGEEIWPAPAAVWDQAEAPRPVAG